jgi:hypothetical protein
MWDTYPPDCGLIIAKYFKRRPEATTFSGELSMAKNLMGYVRFDKQRKRWFFRCAPIDPKTGLRNERKQFFLTQKEAELARRKFLSEFERNGDTVFSREDLTRDTI